MSGRNSVQPAKFSKSPDSQQEIPSMWREELCRELHHNDNSVTIRSKPDGSFEFTKTGRSHARVQQSIIWASTLIILALLGFPPQSGWASIVALILGS